MRSRDLTEGTALLSTWVLAASVVTPLLAIAELNAGLTAALHLIGAVRARGANFDSISATLLERGVESGKEK